MTRRVLVVEDSATARAQIRRVLQDSGSFTIAAEAATCDEALHLLERTPVDVIGLDVVLPDRSAPEAVRELLARKLLPIVLVSDAPRTSPEVFGALAAGALDLVRKPRRGEEPTSFLRLLESLARVKIRQPRVARPDVQHRAVVIGSSTGGPGPLRELLRGLRPGFRAAVLIAQHLSDGFGDAFVRWLAEGCALPVRMAVAGERAQPGVALLAPPGTDLTLRADRTVAIQRAPAAGYHPSADLLFASCARALGAGALGVVLSGIGADGLAGARDIVGAGGRVVAQTPSSCVVTGMTDAVVEAGLTSLVAQPADLAGACEAFVAGLLSPVSIRPGRAAER